MSRFDLRRLVEVAGPRARLVLETDDQGEPRVVQLSPLPPSIEQAVEAVVNGAPPERSRSPEEQRCLDVECACLALVAALRETDRARTRVDLALDVDAIDEERARGLRGQLLGDETAALEKARTDIRTLLGVPL